ncbi:hypothetical protein BCR33DRAFT_233441 [Rhizoclosmatium globosum]|uniref:Methyltransferase FkbM domain-containing protein n=1 Tax=Rhizoclosmatium globosum TaxID=329046 RepID=A0A1Y2CAQ8_9FUNG|nr:hypothetical protein BCR33DRAFT_233441 [Rhizoclosmatium globosum]|eukprot:ORY44016.1 hypothetical protein BCR33DRAFT_233441 [Rhizoclosmatium globosum]
MARLHLKHVVLSILVLAGIYILSRKPQSRPTPTSSKCPPPNSRLLQAKWKQQRIPILIQDPAPPKSASESLSKEASSPFESAYLSDMIGAVRASSNEGKGLVLTTGSGLGSVPISFALEGFHVHAFEQDPFLFSLMACSAAANNFSSFYPNNAALSTSNSIKCADPSIKDMSQCPAHKTIKTITLASYLLETSIKPTLLHLDVSGQELLTLSSAKDILAKAPPNHIYSRFILADMKTNNVNPQDYLDFLLDLGYTIRAHLPTRIPGPGRLPQIKWKDLIIERNNYYMIDFQEYDNAMIHAVFPK